MAKKPTSKKNKWRLGFWQVLLSAIRTIIGGAVWLAKILWKGAVILYDFARERLEESRAREKIAKEAPQLATKASVQNLSLLRTYAGNLAEFEKWLYSSKSTVGIILGSRGSGKSALGARLLENWATSGAKTYAMGFAPGTLPEWIEIIEAVEKAENNSVLLVDEGGIEFSSRDSMSSANKLLSKLLLVCRHKDISLIFIAQNSANLEINSIRQADYLLMKKPSLLQKDFERGKIRDIYAEVDADFAELSQEKGLVYVYSDKFRGFASNALPSFWSERASRAYAGAKFTPKAPNQ